MTRLYKLIGVEVVWLAEPPPDEEVRTIKLTTWEPRDDQFPLALGMTPAQPGTRGTRGYTFWGRVQAASQGFEVPLGEGPARA